MTALIDGARRLIGPNGAQRLSPTEERVLVYLLARRGQRVESDAIRAALWDVMACSNTLKVIICRIRKKIRLTGAPIEILTVGHIGYYCEVLS